jgi:hypothetical protein
MSANIVFCVAGSAVIVESAHFSRAFVWLPDRLIHRIARKLASCEADAMKSAGVFRRLISLYCFAKCFGSNKISCILLIVIGSGYVLLPEKEAGEKAGALQRKAQSAARGRPLLNCRGLCAL